MPEKVYVVRAQKFDENVWLGCFKAFFYSVRLCVLFYLHLSAFNLSSLSVAIFLFFLRTFLFLLWSWLLSSAGFFRFCFCLFHISRWIFSSLITFSMPNHFFNDTRFQWLFSLRSDSNRHLIGEKKSFTQCWLHRYVQYWFLVVSLKTGLGLFPLGSLLLCSKEKKRSHSLKMDQPRPLSYDKCFIV